MAHLKKIAAAGMTLAMVVSVLPMTALAASHRYEWVQKDGKWYYYDGYGRKVKNKAEYDYTDGKYYLLDANGVRVTKKGWYKTKKYTTEYGDTFKINFSYYIGKDGACVRNELKKIGKKYYYFDYDGRMATNRVVEHEKYDEETDDWSYSYYLIGSDGARITKKGWHKIKTTSFNTSTGMKKTSTNYYYILDTKGTVARKCVKKIGKKYYGFDYQGAMIKNGYAYAKNGKAYLFDKKGNHIKKKGWHKISSKTVWKGLDYSETYKGTNWYYVKKDGTLQTGLKKIGKKYYYFEPEMLKCSSRTKNGKTYIFGKSGAHTKIVEGNYANYGS